MARGFRRQAWVIVAGAVAGTALFGTASAMWPKTYESRVEVALTPVSLEARFGAPDAPTTPEQAIARELDHVRSDAVLGRAEAQISFEHSLRAEQGSDDSIVFVARSISGPYAEAVATTASTNYLAVRQENATGQSASSVDFTQNLVDDLTARQATGEDVAAELADAQARLADFQAGAAAVAETAQVSAGPTTPGGAVAPQPWEAALKGLVLGLVGGLLVAAFREVAVVRPVPAAVTGALPRVVIERRDGAAFRAPWFEQRRTALWVLGGLVLARAAFYAFDGANFVLDDWTLEYFRDARGAWSSVPGGQDLAQARPGAWLTFTVLHAVIGPHPLVHFAVLTVINSAVVGVLYAVFSRFFGRSMALLVTAIWVILPIHQSMTVWTGTSQIAVGALLLLLGILALTYGRWFLAGLGLATSILCYELSVPMAFAAIVLVATPLAPLVAGDVPVRVLSVFDRAKVLVMVGLTTWWSREHAVYPLDLRMPSTSTLWSGHFGLGLFGSLATPDLLVVVIGGVAAAGIGLCVVWWLAGDRGRDGGPSLVVAGLGVFVLGLYVAFTVTTGVLGFNDRLYSLSSIGAAMMLAGVGMFLWRRLPMITLGIAGLVLAVALVGQGVSLHSWSQAGGDVVALLRYIDRTYPDPANTDFIVGPSPSYRNNVIGASSPYGGADQAYRLQYPDATGSLIIANSTEEFVTTEKAETLIELSNVLGTSGAP